MSGSQIYYSREKAGEGLINDLRKLKIQAPYLLAIPRGGIQVAEAIADEYRIPLNTIIVKKIPIPGYPEVAMGAMASDGSVVWNEDTLSKLDITEEQLNLSAEKVLSEINHRIEAYGKLNTDEIKNKDIILVDDGIATGYSIITAIKSIKKYNPDSIILVVPVCAKTAFNMIIDLVDTVICPLVEDSEFFAVGCYYKNFKDLPEYEIKNILENYKKYKQK